MMPSQPKSVTSTAQLYVRFCANGWVGECEIFGLICVDALT
jgi:hypothetical protein